MSENINLVEMENSVLAYYEKSFDHKDPLKVAWEPQGFYGALLTNCFLRAEFEQIGSSLKYFILKTIIISEFLLTTCKMFLENIQTKIKKLYQN